MPIACDSKKDVPPSPVTRICCLLNEPASDILEEHEVTSYTYGGGREGLMYTCNGGFLDFGHLFDYVDQTAYYHFFLTKGKANVPGETIKVYHNDKGKVTIKQNVPDVDRPTTAASIAFDFSVFYEIFTFWINSIGAHNSAFSPEDLVSNFTGARIAEKALQAVKTGKKFDEAVNTELRRVLALLVPRTRAQTRDALQAISGVWVDNVFARGGFINNDYLLIRNYNFSPIAPCFVTSPLVGCAGVPAYPSSLGTSFPPHVRAYYDVEYSVDHSGARAELGNTVRRADFSRFIAAIRTRPGTAACA